MKFRRGFFIALIGFISLCFFSSAAQATKCLELEGEPWEDGNSVYIKVKNKCDTPEGFTWEVTTHNFGIQGGSSQVGPKQTGTQSIKPGETATVCAEKPSTPGNYCFLFRIKNKDMAPNRADDSFHKWFNNITVASLPGSGSSGTFAVGGSGLIDNDIVLVAAADNPPGWDLALSSHYVPASSFPATVSWSFVTPFHAPLGDQVTLRVEGYDAESNELIGHADITVLIGAEDIQPVDEGAESETQASNQPQSNDDGGGEGGGDVEPLPDARPPQVSFYAANEQNSRPIVGKELLVAWDENGMIGRDASVTFEILGDDGWEVIGTEQDRAKDSPIGVALVYWDTTSLPAGAHQVRVTIQNENGVGSAERTLFVTKAPYADPLAHLNDHTVTFDAGGSYDEDGRIVEYRWDFGDGTKGEGPAITHTYDRPGRYDVDLTVTDTDGHEDTAYCTVDTYEGKFVCEVRSCGCKKMDVKGAGETAGMDMFWQPAGSKRTLGGVNTVPDPLTPGSYKLFYNFEVEAELVPGSDPAKCQTQQWVNATFFANGAPFHKEYNGQSFPYGNGSYAPDNYTGNSSVQQSNGGKIRWVDGPGFDPIGSGGISGAGASLKAEFMAMVTGPLGTCKCTFEILMEVDKNGKVVQAPVMQNESCSP